MSMKEYEWEINNADLPGDSEFFTSFDKLVAYCVGILERTHYEVLRPQWTEERSAKELVDLLNLRCKQLYTDFEEPWSITKREILWSV